MEERFSEALKRIYAAVADLEKMFPGRHFTPDGHMVGSLGEAIAEYHYGVKLYKPGSHTYDGEKVGKKIQIKTTQGDGTYLTTGSGTLLVFKIEKDGEFEAIYNGDAGRVWAVLADRKETKAGEKMITLKQLRVLNEMVCENEKITKEYE